MSDLTAHPGVPENRIATWWTAALRSRAPMPSRQNRPQPAALAIAVAVLLLAAGASAQPPSEKTRIVSVNLGMQFINDAFHEPGHVSPG